jgi:hypothetical protein
MFRNPVGRLVRAELPSGQPARCYAESDTTRTLSRYVLTAASGRLQRSCEANLACHTPVRAYSSNRPPRYFARKRSAAA